MSGVARTAMTQTSSPAWCPCARPRGPRARAGSGGRAARVSSANIFSSDPLWGNLPHLPPAPSRRRAAEASSQTTPPYVFRRGRGATSAGGRSLRKLSAEYPVAAIFVQHNYLSRESVRNGLESARRRVNVFCVLPSNACCRPAQPDTRGFYRARFDLDPPRATPPRSSLTLVHSAQCQLEPTFIRLLVTPVSRGS